MLAKVIKENESVIYQSKIYKFGDTFEVEDVVGKSLIERGYIQGITDNADLFDEDEVVEIALEDMSYQDLKTLASDLGVSASGKKDELIARIRNAQNGTTDEVEEEEVADELPNTGMPE